MNTSTQNQANNDSLSDAEAEALLAELADSEAAAEEPSVEDLDDRELEMIAASAEEFEHEEEAEDPDMPKVETATKTPEKLKSKKKKAAPGPKLAAGAKPSEVIDALLGGLGKTSEYLAPTEEVAMAADVEKQIEALLANIDKSPKKVGEKVINICKVLKNGVNLSKYTGYALGLIATGEMTTEALRTKYLAHPYSSGTANAQSSQMMALLPLLGIAERSGNKLTLNKDSLLFEALKDLAI